MAVPDRVSATPTPMPHSALHVPRLGEVLIIGGGPAGLATAACLRRRGVPARVLEQGPTVGHSWRQYYDRVRLHTGKHLSALPGLPMSRAYPLYVPRADLVRYLEEYTRHFDLAVSTNERVIALARDGECWRVETSHGVREAPAVVVATGYFHNPHEPAFPGREEFGGPIVHSAAYRNPSSIAGERVLVVGIGNSAAEIAIELAEAGRVVSIAVRGGANIVPRDLFGLLPIQYLAYLLRRLPSGMARPIIAAITRHGHRRLASVGLTPALYAADERIPVIGLELVRAIRAGQVMVKGPVERLGPGTVHFAGGEAAPFDAILLATGYAPVLSFLRGITPDPEALIPAVGVACPAEPGLYFVGYHRTTAGMLYIIRREASEAARGLAAQLGLAGAGGTLAGGATSRATI